MFFVIFAAVTLVFFILRVGGGDPTRTILGKYASPEARENLRVKLGLNRPLYIQYAEFLKKLVTFNFGRSLITRTPIIKIIAQHFPYTIALAAASMFIGSVIGITLGMLAAIFADTKIDHIIRVVVLLFPSMPSYYLGCLFILFLVFYFPLFPASGAGERGNFISQLYHLILPALTLGLIFSGEIARVMRAAALEVIEELYVQVARAKGLGEQIVFLKYVFRNSLIPVVTIIGINFGVIMGASVLVEGVFNRPGIGSQLVHAAQSRDYSIVESLMVIFAFMVAFLNFFVDLLYAWIDPRIQYD